jgi:ABC-type bacteriocin/lantibiotic exporter with double-glycine peptidase domain
MPKEYKRQVKKFACGAACFRNALIVLDGIKISEKKARKIVHTTTQGTDQYDIMKAVEQFDYKYKELKYCHPSKNKFAFNKIKKYLTTGVVFICVDDSEHWILAIKTIRHRIMVIDPALKGLFKMYTLKQLTKRWWCKKTQEYYALAVY